VDFYRGTDHDVRDSVSLHCPRISAVRHLSVTASKINWPQRPQSAPRLRW